MTPRQSTWPSGADGLTLASAWPQKQHPRNIFTRNPSSCCFPAPPDATLLFQLYCSSVSTGGAFRRDEVTHLLLADGTIRVLLLAWLKSSWRHIARRCCRQLDAFRGRGKRNEWLSGSRVNCRTVSLLGFSLVAINVSILPGRISELVRCATISLSGRSA